MEYVRRLVDENAEMHTVVVEEAWESVVEDDYDLDEDWP